MKFNIFYTIFSVLINMRIKLSKWAKENGVTYRTAYNYFINGYLEAIQLPTGTILVEENGRLERKKVTKN